MDDNPVCDTLSDTDKMTVLVSRFLGPGPGLRK